MSNTSTHRREARNGFETLFTHPVLADAVDNASVARRVEYRVRRLARKYCLSAQERQDLRQEFCMTLFRAGEKYDPERCPPERFVRMVLNWHYKHWVRKLARADQKRANSIDTMPFDDVEPDLEYRILDPKGEDDHRLANLRLDVRSVMDRMPEDLRDICEALMLNSPCAVARQRGVHHSTIYRALATIRRHFRRAGLEGLS